jgi:hypothetical protein
MLDGFQICFQCLYLANFWLAIRTDDYAPGANWQHTCIFPVTSIAATRISRTRSPPGKKPAGHMI